jgi:hypothetical protein
LEQGLLRLAAAMIDLAIEDWCAGFGWAAWSPRGKRSTEASDWLFSDERCASLTFKDACNVLGAEPGWMRKMIRAEYGEVTRNDPGT